MKEKSVDLIFADPPYNLGKDFGNDSDLWKDKKKYLEWCYEWIDECFRVLKDNGTFYIMNSTQNIPYISIYLQEHYFIVNDIVWAYDSSGVQSKKKYGSLYEPILMATKNKKVKYTFNYQDILVEAKTGAKRGLIDYRKNPPQPYNTEKVPGNVWEFARVRYKMEEYENHPSQKPEALLERIIKASSNVGEIVLDPFGGSFSTAAVANKLGRRAISMDINREYFKIGIRRTGIAEMYDGEVLLKDKSRKTKNTSKKDHMILQENVQLSLFG
jgi:site-specific DNA-methyltransferase (adenine-specific)